LTAKYRIV